MSDLLPPNATKQERGLSESVARITATPVPIANTWSPYRCPVAILPYLAWALSVDEWDSNWSDTRKRDAIAESVEVHRRKGTIGAVKRALQRLNFEVSIDEDTGAAYTFRVIADVTHSRLSSWESLSEAEQIALRTKNVRSELVGVRAMVKANRGPLQIATVLTNGETTLIYPHSLN